MSMTSKNLGRLLLGAALIPLVPPPAHLQRARRVLRIRGLVVRGTGVTPGILR